MYILNPDHQEALLGKLELLEKRLAVWESVYRDPESGEHWLLFYPHSEYHGGGPAVMRRDPPPHDLEMWLAHCLLRGSPDDAVGLGMEFNKRHRDWSQIVDWLERNRKQITSGHLELFIRSLGVLHTINREETLGKHYIQIQEEHNRYVQLAERAEALLLSA